MFNFFNKRNEQLQKILFSTLFLIEKKNNNNNFDKANENNYFND